MSMIALALSGDPTDRARRSVLILGARGMLGSACARAFGPKANEQDLQDFDLSRRPETRKVIARLRPRLIVNCAAATDVDRCETDHDYADRGNVLTAKHAAQAASEVGAILLHVSTDFVYGGDKQEPYLETDLPSPVNYYGHSKLTGERSVLAEMPDAMIVRTSWLYGQGGTHFPGKVLQWAAAGGPLRIVDDQIGSPTYADDLAACIQVLAEQNHPGIYHLGGTGCVSRFDWAREVLALAGLEVEVLPVPSSDFPLPARRPANSCLDCSKAASLGVQLPDWHDSLARYIRSCRGSC